MIMCTSLTRIVPAPVQAIVNDPSPNTSPALTEGGHTATSNSSPPTPSKSTSPQTAVQSTSSSTTATDAPAKPTTTTAAPPKKRTKLTPAEKEARDKEAEQKKKEREEKQKLADEEKRKKAEEREEKKKQKEEEREEKRKKKEEEDKLKAQKVQEKENKKREAQEAKEKEERKQKRLNSFFAAPSTPKKGPTAAKQEDSPENAAHVAESFESEYHKRFQPFFVKESTTMAVGSTQMDDETRAAKSNILDEFMDGKRTHNVKESPFDAVGLFTLPAKPPLRGKLHHPVRHIMENAYTTEPSTGKDSMKGAREKLSRVPMKVIAFSQDVRPPYFGTVTFKPFALGKEHMRRLGRMSTGRRLPLDYDYDSEAEWQEEEGEDLDAEDDEEEVDDEDDMDGFLDDSDDAGPARIFANAMEPDSTGICYADDGREPNSIILQHKMEIIMGKLADLAFCWNQPLTSTDNFDRTLGLDPWSSTYWQPEPKVITADANGSKMPPPTAPANAFAALTGGAPPGPAVKIVKPEIMNNVKQAIVDNKSLSKIGVIEVLYQQFRDNASRAEVKNTLEAVAEKTGTGRSKEWILRAGHEIA